MQQATSSISWNLGSKTFCLYLMCALEQKPSLMSLKICLNLLAATMLHVDVQMIK